MLGALDVNSYGFSVENHTFEKISFTDENPSF